MIPFFMCESCNPCKVKVKELYKTMIGYRILEFNQLKAINNRLLLSSLIKVHKKMRGNYKVYIHILSSENNDFLTVYIGKDIS